MSGPVTAPVTSQAKTGFRQRCRAADHVRLAIWLLSCVMLCLPAAAQTSAPAVPATTAPAELSDVRPYDDKLVRLSVVLGAVHYLRELCGGNDGQAWRDRMRDLIDHEKGSALRRVKLTKNFNHGYRSYRRTFQTCTAPAQATLTKFMAEGAELSDQLLRETQ